MDCVVHGVAKSQAQLSGFPFPFFSLHKQNKFSLSSWGIYHVQYVIIIYFIVFMTICYESFRLLSHENNDHKGRYSLWHNKKLEAAFES